MEKKISQKEKKELQKLNRQTLELWKRVVKNRAGRKCEFSGCKKHKYLNAHHVESSIMNKGLRYDPENGICLCPTHHKFGWLSAHRSFCFLFKLMAEQRMHSFEYILLKYREKVVLDKDFLNQRIRELNAELISKVISKPWR